MRFLTFASLSLASAIAAVNAAEIFSCTEPNTIALTFDDGPYIYTEDLLNTLKEGDIHATFFMNGNNWWTELSGTPNEQVIGKVAAAGHQIGSHTYNHAIPPTNEERAADFKKMEDLIEKNAGFRPNYFRAPRGECDEACIAYIESLGYKIINWDTDTNDWNYQQFQKDPTVESKDPEVIKAAKKKNVAHVKQYLTEEFAKKKPNYLVLMHDVQDHTVKEIVPWLVQNKPEGYRFVTVAECLGDASLGKAGSARAAPEVAATGAAPATDAQQQQPIVQGNNTYSLQQNSGSMNSVSSLYIVAGLLISSLYMLL